MILHRKLIAACLATSILSACADESPSSDASQDAAMQARKESLAAREEALERRALERVEAPASPVTGEVPTDIMDQLREDLAARGAADATLVMAQATVWPNGAMGCPEPGQMYTQALIEGYRVVFAKGENRWDYRVSQSGGFMLCERQLPLQQSGGNPAK